jgi:hypothetical protein
LQTTLDRHRPRLIIDDGLLPENPDPPLFSLLSTFKRLQIRGQFKALNNEHGRDPGRWQMLGTGLGPWHFRFTVFVV